MIILFDTNVLIAAMISHGICFELFEHCLRDYTLVSSKYIQSEFNEKMTGKFGFTKKETKNASDIVFHRMKIVTPITDGLKGIPDKDDIPVIGTALAANASVLITGDKKLVALKRYQKIPIILPRDFWAFEAKHFPHT